MSTKKTLPDTNINRLKKQRSFALKGCVVVFLIALLCVYMTLDDKNCTEEVDAIVTKSIQKGYSTSGGGRHNYISTEYTYEYAGNTYTASSTTAEKIEPGTIITVFINPDNPKNHTLDNTGRKTALDLLPAWICLFSVLGIFVFVAIKRSIQIRNEESLSSSAGDSVHQ